MGVPELSLSLSLSLSQQVMGYFGVNSRLWGKTPPTVHCESCVCCESRFQLSQQTAFAAVCCEFESDFHSHSGPLTRDFSNKFCHISPDFFLLLLLLLLLTKLLLARRIARSHSWPTLMPAMSSPVAPTRRRAWDSAITSITFGIYF